MCLALFLWYQVATHHLLVFFFVWLVFGQKPNPLFIFSASAILCLSQEQTEAEVAEQKSALERRVLSRAQADAARPAGVGKQKAKAKGKQAVKAKAASAGRPRQTQIAALEADITAGITLQSDVTSCTSLEALKEYETDLKEMSSNLSGKEDLMIELEMDDKLNDYRSLEKFLSASKEALRAWKAYHHTGSDKNWRSFRSSWMDALEDMPAPCHLRAAGSNDIVKAHVIRGLNEGDFTGSAAQCVVNTMMATYKVTDDQARAHQHHIA